MVFKFFDKKSPSLANKSTKSDIKNQITQNQQLAEELHKPIIKNFKRRTVYSTFKGNIWGVHFAGMQLISKFNKGIRFFLCVTDNYCKYA